MLVLSLLACVPHLYTDGQGEPLSWLAPENGWYAGQPPDGFEAAGFQTGDVVPELVGFDQNGDEVSTWQFYGRVTVLDISTMWCGPCQDLATGVEHTQETYADEVVYATILPENIENKPPSQEDLAYWADSFGIETAPVIADHDFWYEPAVPDGTFPKILVTYDDMTVCESDVAPNDGAVIAAIEACL
jgi:thiol-disulfide isomerase/thioredoxin